MGPTRTTTRQQTLTRGVEDKAADILALARSLVHENDATLGRSKSTLRKTMRKTQTQRAATTSPTSKLRTTRWKSRTMQQLASGQRPELDFGPTKDELAGFDNDGQLMSIKDHCAVPPPEPRKPIIEPPTDVAAFGPKHASSVDIVETIAQQNARPKRSTYCRVSMAAGAAFRRAGVWPPREQEQTPGGVRMPVRIRVRVPVRMRV